MEVEKLTIVILVILFIFTILFLNYFSLFSTKKYNFNFNGTSRDYLLHLPSFYKSSNTYPLVVALHGYGDHPRFMEQYTNLSRKADKEKFLVVYPYGTKNNSIKKFSWNGGSCCGEALNKNIDDVLFINNLVEDLEKKYKIDPKKIYLTGFSNGGLLTYRIASEKPDKFAAFAVVAGSIGGKSREKDPYYTIPTPKKPVPIIIMHGKKDESIIYSGGLNKQKNASFTSFDESKGFWIRNNNVNKKITTEDDKAIHESYQKSKEGERLDFYTIKEGLHIWFGGAMEIKNNFMGKSISATNTIWAFFKDI